jgi:hypothetical protein
MKVVRLSDLRTGRLYLQEIFLAGSVTFCNVSAVPEGLRITAIGNHWSKPVIRARLVLCCVAPGSGHVCVNTLLDVGIAVLLTDCGLSDIHATFQEALPTALL